MFSTQNYSMADADSLYDMSSDQDQDLSAVDADAEEERTYYYFLKLVTQLKKAIRMCNVLDNKTPNHFPLSPTL
jgi:hypothetical protein